MKPAFIQEKKNPCSRHLPLKKILIYRTENGIYDQETYPSAITSSRITRRNLATPLLALKRTTGRTDHNSSLYIVTSSLLVLNLSSNAVSHSSYMTKRRTHHVTDSISICPPLKREFNGSYFTSPSLSASNKASALNVKHTSEPSFPKILATPSEE